MCPKKNGHFFGHVQGKMVIPLGMPMENGHSIRYAKKGCGHLLQRAEGGWAFAQACQGWMDILMGVRKKDGHSLVCVRALAHYHTQRAQGFAYRQAQARIGMVCTRTIFLRARHIVKPNRVQVWLTSNLACPRFCILPNPITSKSRQRQTQLSQGLAHCQTLCPRTWYITKSKVSCLARARSNASLLACACFPKILYS